MLIYFWKLSLHWRIKQLNHLQYEYTVQLSPTRLPDYQTTVWVYSCLLPDYSMSIQYSCLLQDYSMSIQYSCLLLDYQTIVCPKGPIDVLIVIWYWRCLSRSQRCSRESSIGTGVPVCGHDGILSTRGQFLIDHQVGQDQTGGATQTQRSGPTPARPGGAKKGRCT